MQYFPRASVWFSTVITSVLRLMKSLKSSGRLTHGSGMTEKMRILWTLSTHIASQYNDVMQKFSGLAYTTSHQHWETTLSKLKQDFCDLENIKEKPVTCMPISPDLSLKNIITGVIDNVHS